MNHLQPLREAQPGLTWEELVARAYMTRTQLAAFGFYNSSNLDYE